MPHVPNDGSPWRTLVEIFEEVGRQLPLTVFWRDRGDGNRYGLERLRSEDGSRVIRITFSDYIPPRNHSNNPTFVPSPSTLVDHPDMPNHMGYATEAAYKLATTPKIEEIPIMKEGYSIKVTEYMSTPKAEEWKSDQEYRVAIGHLVRLNKVSKNRYLDQAITSAKSARLMQDPRRSYVPHRKYVLTWFDRRLPAHIHGRISAETDIKWYPPKTGNKEVDAANLQLYQAEKRQRMKGMMANVRTQIREARRAAREVHETAKRFSSTQRSIAVNYRVLGSTRRIASTAFKFSKPQYEVSDPNKAGFVHTQEGMIQWLMYRKQGDVLNDRKVPLTADKYIGIELEFFSKLDRDALGLLLYRTGLAKQLTLKGDGSIRPEDKLPHAHELCILAKESEYEDVVKKVCIVLEKAGSKVNKSCGMHVHLDMRNRNRETAFANLVSSQNILYAMNPASRLEESNGQRYCAYTRSRRMDQQTNRYHGINGQAFRTHQTIECRIHSGTFQPRKIINWVRLLLYIVNREQPVARSSSKLRGFVKQFNLPMDLAEYIVERIKKFNDKTPANQEEAA